MANRKKIKKKFGLSGGRHGKKRTKSFNREKYTYNVELKLVKPKSKNVCKSRQALQNKLKIYRRKVLHNIFHKNRRVWTNRKLFLKEHKTEYTVTRVSLDEPFKFRISKVSSFSSDGYRMINLELLQKHIGEISLHIALCKGAYKLSNEHVTPIKLVTELKTLGLASLLVAECQGCGKQFNFESSPKIRNGSTNHYDINVRAVWGSMVTCGGVAHLNETMATMNAPGMSQNTYTRIEQEIGDMWANVADQDLLANGAEERRIAIEKGNYHEGVPAISVICDGGWSKRSHKHTYNALGGVAIIIGAETGKLLHIGVRNKHCYICNAAENNETVPKLHRCFKNWNSTSQSMESDIILEGFLKAETTHGLRYTKLIADGDSSVFAKLQEGVPIWGKAIEKIECANHVCKCLRSSLEKLVDENPLYKGKNNLPKSLRLRLVSSVRCAIRMRSNEDDKSVAARKLEHDIRNSVHHIYGNHTNCSDFCKASHRKSKQAESDSTLSANGDAEDCTSMPDLINGISQLWTETTSIQLQDESRECLDCDYDLDSLILRDISILLDRVASKSSRLISNNTTNLAECWMSVRTKFDGGKMYNRCNRGSWQSRCMGGCLRMNLGPKWSTEVWEQTTSTKPGHFFVKLYDKRANDLKSCKKSKRKPEIQARRWKRKYNSAHESNSKKAKQDYGPEAIDSCPDLTTDQLKAKEQSFLSKHINITDDKIKLIESATRKQSVSAVWMDERKKRLTASNFGCVIKCNPSISVKKLVQSLLYSKFTGNVHTRKGLQEEAMTLKEYKIHKELQKKKVNIAPTGLIISREHKFLAASPDGKVFEKNIMASAELDETDISVGLIEIKNLLHSKPINLFEAAKEVKNFCLDYDGKTLNLRKNHIYYHQVQGQLSVCKLPWADFVVRTLNPYHMHVERIERDESFWRSVMLPKLESFYMKVLLPELAAPRNNTITGIREPGVWFENNSSSATTKIKTKKRSNTKEAEFLTPPPGPSAPQERNRSRRNIKIKFVGRRIQHEWIEDEASNKTKWYTGTVVGTSSGKDGDPAAVYDVLYDGDDEPYSIDHLTDDFHSSSVKFIDL